MICKEVQAAIDRMLENRRAKRKRAENIDPALAWMDAVFTQRREGMRRARSAPLPDGLSVEYALADGVPGEWLRVVAIDPDKIRDKAILFLHGGGFADGSALSRRPLAVRLVRHAKIDSFSIDYRQCPEYMYPAHLDDCVTAYLWLMKQGYVPRNILFFGESAGGNLALALTHYLKDHYFPLPGGVCAFSPVTELAEPFDSWVTRANRDAMIGFDLGESELPAQLKALRSGTKIPRLFYCTPEEAKLPYVSPIRGGFSDFRV